VKNVDFKVQSSMFKVAPRIFFETVFAVRVTEIVSDTRKEKASRCGMGIDFHMTNWIFG
jgi:hypothetical protein